MQNSVDSTPRVGEIWKSKGKHELILFIQGDYCLTTRSNSLDFFTGDSESIIVPTEKGKLSKIAPMKLYTVKLDVFDYYIDRLMEHDLQTILAFIRDRLTC